MAEQDLPTPWQCETAMCPNLYTGDQMRAHAFDYHLAQMKAQGFENGAVSLWAYNRRGEALQEARAALEASRAKCALLAAEVEGLRAGLQDIANLTSVEIDMCLLMPVTMAGKTLAAAAPNQGEAG